MVDLSMVGTKVVGCTFGTVEELGGEYFRGPSTGFAHDGDYYSFETLWMDIGMAPGATWKIEVKSKLLPGRGFDELDVSWMTVPKPRGVEFVVTRLP